MFLGLRAKSRKGPSVQVDYVVHVQEITPWPPSQSLKSLRSVVLHWEYGDSVSGLTAPVVPLIADGRIEFNKSFKIHVTLIKDGPVKGHDGGQYHKNLLELNLYEPRNKNAKGQHIGGVVVDMAEHGILKKPVSIGVPFICKRSFKNISQPVVYIKIQPVGKVGSSSSLESLPKEVLSDKDGKESVSSLMTEENTEEIDVASFTDDENESHQSSNDLEPNKITVTKNEEYSLHARSVSVMPMTKNEVDSLHARSASALPDFILSVDASFNEALPTNQIAMPLSSVDRISTSPEADDASSTCSLSTFEITQPSDIPRVDFSVLSTAYQKATEEIRSNATEVAKVDSIQVADMLVECDINTIEDLHQPSGRNDEQQDFPSSDEIAVVGTKLQEKIEVQKHSTVSESFNTANPRELHSPQLILSHEVHGENTQLNDERGLKSTLRLQGSNSPVLSRRSLGGRTYSASLNNEKNAANFLRLQLSNDQDIEDVKEINVLEATYHDRKKTIITTGKVYSSSNKQDDLSDYKIQELEKKVKMLEGTKGSRCH